MTSLPQLDQHDPLGWIAWKGGKCPEHPDTIVRPWLKSIGESKDDRPASYWNWGKRIEDGSRLPGSVLGYRIVKEAG